MTNKALLNKASVNTEHVTLQTGADQSPSVKSKRSGRKTYGLDVALAILVGSASLMGGACAQDVGANDPAVKSLDSKIRTLYPNTSFKEVRATPVEGLFEVTMGSNIAYTDASARYFVFGHLFDMQTQVDLTASRLVQAKKVEFPSAFLGNAIKTVKGDGSRVVAVFSDPDCPYCKQLEATLVGLNNVTIYTFLFPLESLHPQAKTKATSIWCSADKAGSWSAAMLQGKAPALRACANPINDNLVLGGRLGVTGTPTLIAADGRVMPGAASLAQIDQWLGAAQ